MRRGSVKFPGLSLQRPMPRMPELAGFAPCYEMISAVSAHNQPIRGLRPLYWWVRELRRRGDTLADVRFDTATATATVVVRLASYQMMTVQRRHDSTAALPHDLVTLIAEAAWRLGALGWATELHALTEQLALLGLIIEPAPAQRCTEPIPGVGTQPDRAVRIAYWWAAALKGHGWTLSDCGDEVAAGGFIAEIPCADGSSDLVVYRGDMADDGTEASALANHLARLDHIQRGIVTQLVGDTVAGQGQAS